MMDAMTDPIQRGLEAWMRGDLDALEALLDPQVSLRGVQSGPWNCSGRDEVMELLRRRQAERAGRPPQPIRMTRLDENTYLVSSGNDPGDDDPEPQQIATRVTISGNKVIRMQQFHPTPGDPQTPRGAVDDDVAEAAVEAVQAGDLAALNRLLADHPQLATFRLQTRAGRTLLHVATDWPGHFPNVAAIIGALVAAGGDVNAASIGGHAETPLHWAASSDDIEAVDSLLDAGANIDAPGGAIGNASPLFNATVFGQWQVARRLVERGAEAGLWEAAVMGLLPQVQQRLAEALPSQEEIDDAFWGACHGGQLDTAVYLLDRGADIDRVAWDDLSPLQAAQRSDASELVDWLRAQGAFEAPTAADEV